MRLLAAILLTFATGLTGGAAQACGPDTDCMIGERTYRIVMPDAAPRGALIYAHGYRGSARGVMKNKGLRRFAAAHGLALVAPKSAEDDWRIPGTPSEPTTDGARELAYHDALRARLTEVHGIPADTLVMTGFSAGGMLTWVLACERGSHYRAFIPIAGTFWAPVPSDCPDPARTLVHVHGTSDGVVPLVGRPIASTRQGNVFEALALLQSTGDFGAAEASASGDLACESQATPTGRSLTYCAHPGGHSFKTGYLGTAFERIGLGGL